MGFIGVVTEKNEPTGQAIKSDTLKTYTNEDLYTLIFNFVGSSSPYTELQKEEQFKNYKGKWIKDLGVVKEVDTVMLSDNIVVAIINPDNTYLRGATIYFKPSEKEKLLETNLYDEINFEGRIEDYNGFMGIIIKDAELR